MWVPVFILADDLGYGDVSAFNGGSKIKSTHIDALAGEGMRFTDAHSGSAVCTPTRYGILTVREVESGKEIQQIKPPPVSPSS